MSVNLQQRLARIASSSALTFVISNATLASPALAESVAVLGDHNQWSSYQTTGADAKLCFTLSKATSTQPSPSGYTQGYFYITHRPNEGVRYEINVVAGFQFAENANANIIIGAQRFPLFTSGDAAWLADTSKAANVAQAIRAGSSMMVEATSIDGTIIRQNYSLSGATAAQRVIDGAC